jgi:tRNA pseudouridine55 synthase
VAKPKSGVPDKHPDKQIEKAALSGFLNIDKPAGMTSHDVVNRVRRIVKQKQVGHAGTLDPMATGVMVVAIGRATRLLRFLADDKSYVATIKLGQVTDTDDVEGKTIAEDERAVSSPPSQEEIQKALEQFSGDIEQIPPFYSAIHVDGKRLYELARSGQAPPEIKARPVTIHKLDLLSYVPPNVVIRVHCSKGTYIRSIARDLGQTLGLGGCLAALVRETSGRFKLADAADLEALKSEPERAATIIVPVEDALPTEVFMANEEATRKLKLGQKVHVETLTEEQDKAEYLLVKNIESHKPFCIVRKGIFEENGSKYLAPEVVFADA